MAWTVVNAHRGKGGEGRRLRGEASINRWGMGLIPIASIMEAGLQNKVVLMVDVKKQTIGIRNPKGEEPVVKHWPANKKKGGPHSSHYIPLGSVIASLGLDRNLVRGRHPLVVSDGMIVIGPIKQRAQA